MRTQEELSRLKNLTDRFEDLNNCLGDFTARYLAANKKPKRKMEPERLKLLRERAAMEREADYGTQWVN